MTPPRSLLFVLLGKALQNQARFIRTLTTAFRLNTVHRLMTAAIILPTLLNGCSEPAPPPEAPVTQAPEPVARIPASQADTAQQALWQSNTESLTQLRNSALELQKQINQLLTSPSQATLSASQLSWERTNVDLRRYYFSAKLSATALDAFDFPRDQYFLIAAYPIMPGFIDSFAEYAFSGLVHDISTPISEKSLREQHGLTDSEEVILGLYAIEYLLFGYELGRSADDFKAEFSLTQAQIDAGFNSPQETPNNRRRALLNQQMQLMLADLAALQNAWQNQAGIFSRWNTYNLNQRVEFVEFSINTSLTQMLIELVKMNQSSGTESDGVSYEGFISPATANMPIERKIEWFSLALQSIEPALEYLEEPKQLAAKNQFKTLYQTLGMLPEADAEKSQEHWKAIYAGIKSLAENKAPDSNKDSTSEEKTEDLETPDAADTDA